MNDPLSERDQQALAHLARIVLPSSLDGATRAGAVAAFAAWVAGYEAGAEMDHGYGFTRLRQTGAHPGPGYASDLEELRRRARSEHGEELERLDDDRLRGLVVTTLDIADADENLPGRPDDSHVLIALMTHWFRSPAAQDLCYGVQIGRESCRGLFMHVDGLEPLAGD